MKKVLIFAILALGVFGTAQSQTLDFTLAASSSDGANVVPKLTWATTPVAASCAATGNWSGSKAASGTQVLPAVPATSTQSYVLTCSWAASNTVIVNWQNPTKNTDGTTYSDHAGSKVVYGTSPTALNTIVDVPDPVATSRPISGLAPGTYYFAVRAVNRAGISSAQSNVVSRIIAPPAQVSRTLGLAVTVPEAPVVTLE